jgi:hypothetical protein
MLNRSMNTIYATDFPRGVARERRSAVVFLIVALYVGGTAICMALIVPILGAAVTETAQRPILTYPQCGAVEEDTDRLACYDRVLHQNSPYSAKDMH